MVVDAQTEDAVRAGSAADPWMRIGLLRVAEVTPWEILLGGSAD